MNTTKTCGRKGCNELGLHKDGGSHYCPKHYRFKRMRQVAKQDGKVVPSWEQCEEMLLLCLNEHGELGLCPCCLQQMQWKAGDDKKTGRTISLQHNLDGTMCFICHSCNTGHGHSSLGDDWFETQNVSDGHKFCPYCKEIKLIDQFHNNQATRDGVGNICGDCKCKNEAERRSARDADPTKREAYLAKAREYDRKYRAAVDADPVKREAYLARKRESNRKYRAAKKQEVAA